MKKKIKLPKNYSIYCVYYKEHSLIVELVKDKKVGNAIAKQVPIRVIQGL